MSVITKHDLSWEKMYVPFLIDKLFVENDLMFVFKQQVVFYKRPVV